MARKRNTWFQFKQFRVDQDSCGMKVTFDACLFGALIDVTHSQRILDIGTGTGLLSLMVAQRCNAHIDAVELEADAVIQARNNVEKSPWSHQLSVIHSAIQDLPEETGLYDTIICNPPFFENSLKAENSQRNIARHTDTLDFSDLVEVISQKLTISGVAWILLPITSSVLFMKHVNTREDLRLTAQVNMRSVALKPDHRHALAIEKITVNTDSLINTTGIIGRTPNGEYSSHVKELLTPYFLSI